MALSDLAVLHARGAERERNTIIHGFDGRETVLAEIEWKALDDYFQWPWSLPDRQTPSPPERDLVVDRNLAALEPIIQDKYQRGEYTVLNRAGSSIKRIAITSADIRRGQIELIDSVLQTARQSGFVKV
jgi:hypothetical protein